MFIQKYQNLNILKNQKILLFNISKIRFTTKSHLQQIVERENTILEQLRSGTNFTKEEISEFARVLKKINFDKDLFQKFENELPKHIKSFNELELRKVISLCLSSNNNGMMQSEEIVDSLSERLDAIYTEKDRNGISLAEFKVNKRNYLKNQPYAYQFWIKFYSMKCKFVDIFKKYGISSK